jgi:hypothetical protein
MLSDGARAKFVPVIVTLEPTLPEVGLKEEIVTTCAAVSNEKAAAQTMTRTDRSIVFIVLSPMLAETTVASKRKLILDFISTSNTWDCGDTAIPFRANTLHCLTHEISSSKVNPPQEGFIRGNAWSKKKRGENEMAFVLMNHSCD